MTSVSIPLVPLAANLTRASVVRYAGASTDFNPLHWSDRYAIALKLPGVIAHGLYTMGLALRIATDWLGDPAAVIRYTCRFGRPVVLPDTDEGVELKITGRVVDVTDERVTIHLQATVAGAPVLTRVVCEAHRPPADSPAGQDIAAALGERAG
ncbi:MAG: dehydratase [Propionibacteriaceae bacterium]|jgi:acyl dehydratase|nr:dehydratase [Propionibacteriaceae bacterium]